MTAYDEVVTSPLDATAILKRFFARVPQATSKYQRDSYRGDRVALKNFSLPSRKQLPKELFETNYFQRYLEYCTRSEASLEEMERFMLAKLEPERWLQWTGPWDSTITQVTPTTSVLTDTTALFDLALLNIFSATLKPVDTKLFLRAIKLRFKVFRYEAFSAGPDGLFRQDMPESLKMQRYDTGSDIGPYKPSPDGAVATPTFLPSRVCINWAPGVDFSEVEQWWQGLMMRPVLQRRPDPPSHTRLKDMDIEASTPMLTGVRLIKVALKPEFSHLRSDLIDRTVEPMSEEVRDFSDDMLLAEPVDSDRSSEVSFGEYED